MFIHIITLLPLHRIENQNKAGQMLETIVRILTAMLIVRLGGMKQLQ